MRKIPGVALGVAVMAGLSLAAPASAANGPVRETAVKSLSFQYDEARVCHNVKVVANGQVLVDNVGCQP